MRLPEREQQSLLAGEMLCARGEVALLRGLLFNERDRIETVI